jgi:GH18 family chitinase
MKYTREAGFLAYYEICQKLQQGWTRVWNEEQKVPYAYNGNEWVGYEDVESLNHKVVIIITDYFNLTFNIYYLSLFKIAFLKNIGIGGVMFWVFQILICLLLIEL